MTKKKTAAKRAKIDIGNEKTRYDLLSAQVLKDVANVMTVGAKKYSAYNYRELAADDVDNFNEAYYAAAMRHIQAWRMGEELDAETDLPHLAHAMACLLILQDV